MENLCELSRALEVHYVIEPRYSSQTHSFRFILWSELAVNKLYIRIDVFEQLIFHLNSIHIFVCEYNDKISECVGVQSFQGKIPR
jgi:hypothetical protein